MDDEVRDARPDPADREIGGDGGAHIRDASFFYGHCFELKSCKK